MPVHRLAVVLTALTLFAQAVTADSPLKVLYLTSPGIYHDYAYQAEAIPGALAKSINVQFDVSLAELEGWKTTDYGSGYDAIIYNICHADNTDSDLIANMRRQTEVLSVPAIVVHCAMHSFRETDEWWPLYGLKTVAHEPIGEMPLKHAATHPLLTGIPGDWTAAYDELYINLEFGAQPLLTAQGKDGKTHVIAWTQDAAGTRLFGTTLGHSTETIDDPIFQTLLRNALLWVTGKLQADGSAAPGLEPNPGVDPVNDVSKAEGVDYLTNESRSCMRKEMGKAVGPCYLGCILHPLKWGEAADSCKQECISGMPSSDELIGACGSTTG